MAKPDTDRLSPSAKRKLEDSDSDSDSDSDVGPQLPSAKQNAPDAPAKRARTIGPAMPPPGMIPQADESSNNSDSSDDEDDDYGPSLPPPNGADATQPSATHRGTTSTSSGPAPVEPGLSTTTTSKRDDWMLKPPDELDLSSRVDPTKLRNRKFNTAPSRPGPATGPSKMWTETPEEKRRRLENEVMGIQAPAAAAGAALGPKQLSEEEMKKAKMVKDYNVSYMVGVGFGI